MVDLQEFMLRLRGRPIRREVNVLVSEDSDEVEPIEGRVLSQSENGSFDTTRIISNRFYSCGCTADLEIGGRCSRCPKIVCKQHLALFVCVRCSTPLCPDHSRLVSDGEQNLRMCLSCSNITWPRLGKRLQKLLG